MPGPDDHAERIEIDGLDFGRVEPVPGCRSQVVHRVLAEHGPFDGETEDEERERTEALEQLQRTAIREDARRLFESAGVPPEAAARAADVAADPGLPGPLREELQNAARQRERELAEGLIPDPDEPTTPGQIVRLLERRLREARQDSLARIVSKPTYAALSEHEKAELDALIFGVGYVCKGKRIDPTTVNVFQPPSHLHERFPKR